MKIFADTHIHSCLSPCAHEEMTPNNIVNMALIKGLELIAVTDHNRADNLRAVAEAAEGTGLCVVPGMELESSEEEDNILREEPKLLVQPLELSIDQLVPMIRKFGGEAVPAHIDRPSHGIIPLLGFISPYLDIKTAEISAAGMASGFKEYPEELMVLTASDAHDLGNIFEAVHQIEL